MIDTTHVFVADAKPALALPSQRVAYVFGAAHPLGEALLNQLLASSQYHRVYVSTLAPLPATVAHLQAVVSGQPFALQDQASAVDVYFVAADLTIVPASPANSGFSARTTVYAALAVAGVPDCLRQVSIASPNTVASHWFVIAPTVTAALASSWVASYSAHHACTVYGLAAGDKAATGGSAYQFKPQSAGLLDRLGVWVLNVLSNAAHGMMNPQKNAPLTTVKTAQRLMAQWHSQPSTAASNYATGLRILTPTDLLA